MARDQLESLALSADRWAIPWPCAHEFVAVVTNPRIYKTPTPVATAISQLDALRTQASATFIAELDDHLDQLGALAIAAQTQGGMIHDARVAAICISNGVAQLWSADRDFSRFPALKVRNPLIGSE
jgi:uncharacterized protein